MSTKINQEKKQSNSLLKKSLEMELMEKRVKKLTIRLWAGIFTLFLIIIAGFFVLTNIYYNQLALAVTGSYLKGPGDTLTAAEWNNLENDFNQEFGAWQTMVTNTNYQASTDGIVSAFNGAGGVELIAYTDAGNPPTIRRADATGSSAGEESSITMPVRKGDWWRVESATSVYWLPMGN